MGCDAHRTWDGFRCRTVRSKWHYGVGRQGGLFNALAGQLNAWQGGLDLKPIIFFDERVAHGYLQ